MSLTLTKTFIKQLRLTIDTPALGSVHGGEPEGAPVGHWRSEHNHACSRAGDTRLLFLFSRLAQHAITL